MITPEKNNHEEDKTGIEGKTFIIKKKSVESYPAAYFEYFNDDNGSQELDIDNDDDKHDMSVVTMLENNDAISSLWEKDPRQYLNEGENSEEEIKTARISNPCTPIQDMDTIPSHIDTSFLWNDNSEKHILNNLFYGNYKQKSEGKK